MTVRWNSYAETVAADRPDGVIVATGGLPDAYVAEGGEHCLSIWDALTGADLSGAILIYDEHGTLPNEGLFKSLRAGSSNGCVTEYAALIAGEPQTADPDSGECFLLFRVGDAVSSGSIHAAIYDSLRLCKDL